MRYELFDGARSVGSVTWEGPGQVRYELADPEVRRYFEDRFADESVYLTGAFDPDGEGMVSRRGDWSPAEFERAVAMAAARRAYTAVPRTVGPVEDRAWTDAWEASA